MPSAGGLGSEGFSGASSCQEPGPRPHLRGRGVGGTAYPFPVGQDWLWVEHSKEEIVCVCVCVRRALCNRGRGEGQLAHCRQQPQSSTPGRELQMTKIPLFQTGAEPALQKVFLRHWRRGIEAGNQSGCQREEQVQTMESHACYSLAICLWLLYSSEAVSLLKISGVSWVWWCTTVVPAT